MNPRKPTTAVARAADQLREIILGGEDGAYLGSEEQLIERLGVSRPTFRQAARLLDHEQILASKRGHSGGFYARWPSIDAVAHNASIYLRVERASIRDVSIAAAQLVQEASRLAALSTDKAARRRFEEFLEQDRRALASTQTADDFMRSEAEFIDLLGVMCGNPVIKLFVSILYQFGAPLVFRHVCQTAERVAASRDARIRVSEAVLSGDAELAMLLWRRRGELQYGWLLEELGDGGIIRAHFGKSGWSKPRHARGKRPQAARRRVPEAG